jgi:hypothetical protein
MKSSTRHAATSRRHRSQVSPTERQVNRIHRLPNDRMSERANEMRTAATVRADSAPASRLPTPNADASAATVVCAKRRSPETALSLFSFESFRYACPEPVLITSTCSMRRWRKEARFRTCNASRRFRGSSRHRASSAARPCAHKTVDQTNTTAVFTMCARRLPS